MSFDCYGRSTPNIDQFNTRETGRFRTWRSHQFSGGERSVAPQASKWEMTEHFLPECGMPSVMAGRRKPAETELYEHGNLTPVVFITVCTKDRKPILANPDIHELLVDIWSDEKGHWLVGRYVLMPDHLHLFCSPRIPNALGIKKWVKYWKSRASSRWPRPNEHPIWLNDVWDTQLRTGESYSGKWDYVRNNPGRHGLVSNTDDWPYQGEQTILDWHAP